MGGHQVGPRSRTTTAGSSRPCRASKRDVLERPLRLPRDDRHPRQDRGRRAARRDGRTWPPTSCSRTPSSSCWRAASGCATPRPSTHQHAAGDVARRPGGERRVRRRHGRRPAHVASAIDGREANARRRRNPCDADPARARARRSSRVRGIGAVGGQRPRGHRAERRDRRRSRSTCSNTADATSAGQLRRMARRLSRSSRTSTSTSSPDVPRWRTHGLSYPAYSPLTGAFHERAELRRRARAPACAAGHRCAATPRRAPRRASTPTARRAILRAAGDGGRRGCRGHRRHSTTPGNCASTDGANCAAIDALEADVIDPSQDQSTTAVLDKLSGAALIGARQRQARAQLLAGVLEQLLVDSKRARDTRGRDAEHADRSSGATARPRTTRSWPAPATPCGPGGSGKRPRRRRRAAPARAQSAARPSSGRSTTC